VSIQQICQTGNKLYIQMNKQRGNVIGNQKGMTLVEVIVSMAIVAVVATIVVGAFISALRFQEVTRDKANDSASIEEQIAGFASPDQTQALPGGGINLGGYLLPAQTQTYNSGTGSFTVLDGNSAPQISRWEYGDGAPNINGSVNTGANGTAGNMITFTATMTGNYRIELWGAQGNGANSAMSWHGAYVSFETRINKDDAFKLSVGGLGPTGNAVGGASLVITSSNTVLAAAGGGDNNYGKRDTTTDASLSNVTIIYGDQQMPDPLNPTGSTITGKTGGGYICITYLGA
jgi:prepilin-type N-terminal cleavage/methylation domain-containing protein